jgi:membrane carboxypeptidase/penicillin-binding protein PbpC
MKAPHFVERVREYLQQNEFNGVTFDADQLSRGGFIVKTTLDYDIQKMSEDSFQENIKTINGYGANNSSMIYLDSLNGDVIAYVGSLDYNNEEIDGKVDMVQGLKQV